MSLRSPLWVWIMRGNLGQLPAKAPPCEGIPTHPMVRENGPAPSRRTRCRCGTRASAEGLAFWASPPAKLHLCSDVGCSDLLFLLPSTDTTAGSIQGGLLVLVVDVYADRGQQDDALDHLLVIDADADDGHAVVHHAHHECADDGAENLADAARVRRAADEAGRDHVELE